MNNDNHGKIFVISGPSGVGKGTVIQELRQKDNSCSLTISHTTRQPRKGEINGKDYHFVSRNEFEKMIKKDQFWEWAEVHGNYYGTSKKMLNELISCGKKIIFEVDVQGGINLKKIKPEICSIFILPPSKEELIRRINKRGSETKETLEKRMATMEKEMPYANQYDFQIVNEKLEETIEKIIKIINNG